MRAMLYEDPHPTDLEGWKRHLGWLSAQSTDLQGRDLLIEDAAHMVSLLETTPLSKRPADAA